MVISVGPDRPGVVAALAGALVEMSCNLSDTQMAVLQGYASMMLVVDAPPAIDAENLKVALVRDDEGLSQTIWVHVVPELATPPGPPRQWMVSVHGADRPGVVFEITRLLADLGINIVDLQTRILGRTGSLAMKVEVPDEVDGHQLISRVDQLGEQLGLTCSIRPGPEWSPGASG